MRGFYSVVSTSETGHKITIVLQGSKMTEFEMTATGTFEEALGLAEGLIQMKLGSIPASLVATKEDPKAKTLPRGRLQE
jgi:hypothetical protein